MPNNGPKIELGDFINPNSMITPGAAGAFTMVITNTLVSQFGGLPGNWTALVVSFLFGALTFLYTAAMLPRLLYFVVNSLIIFVMANGSNTIGATATRRADVPDPAYQVASVVSPAIADDRTGGEIAQRDRDDKDGFFRRWTWSPP